MHVKQNSVSVVSCMGMVCGGGERTTPPAFSGHLWLSLASLAHGSMQVTGKQSKVSLRCRFCLLSKQVLDYFLSSLLT